MLRSKLGIIIMLCVIRLNNIRGVKWGEKGEFGVVVWLLHREILTFLFSKVFNLLGKKEQETPT